VVWTYFELTHGLLNTPGICSNLAVDLKEVVIQLMGDSKNFLRRYIEFNPLFSAIATGMMRSIQQWLRGRRREQARCTM
jgi:hypothetical protein